MVSMIELAYEEKFRGLFCALVDELANGVEEERARETFADALEALNKARQIAMEEMESTEEMESS